MILFKKKELSAPLPHPDKALYPRLSDFAGAILNQDYDIYGETLDEVLEYIKEEGDSGTVNALRHDIDNFLHDKRDLPDEDFTSLYEKAFYPTISIEGYEGKTTREWLQYFSKSLSEGQKQRD